MNFMSQYDGSAKRSEKGLLTPDNCVVALIDHQQQMLFGTSNFDRQSIINSTVALAKATRIFYVPVVLSTVETKSFSGNMWPQVKAIFPHQEPIERSSMNSWDDRNFVAAIEETGKKKIVLAGLWTEICVALPTVQAIHDGYEVYVVEDCCGDVSQLAHDNAMRRVFQAGAKPVTALIRHARMAARPGSARYLRRRDGRRQEPFRSIRHRRRIRVHDGPWGASDPVPRVFRPPG
jgi:nicotinamidase-related amidase